MTTPDPAAEWLHVRDIALTEPREEPEQQGDDRIHEPFATTGIPLGATLIDCNDDVWILVGRAADGEAVWQHDGEQADLDGLFGEGLAPFRLDWFANAPTGREHGPAGCGNPSCDC